MPYNTNEVFSLFSTEIQEHLQNKHQEKGTLGEGLTNMLLVSGFICAESPCVTAFLLVTFLWKTWKKLHLENWYKQTLLGLRLVFYFLVLTSFLLLHLSQSPHFWDIAAFCKTDKINQWNRSNMDGLGQISISADVNETDWNFIHNCKTLSHLSKKKKFFFFFCRKNSTWKKQVCSQFHPQHLNFSVVHIYWSHFSFFEIVWHMDGTSSTDVLNRILDRHVWCHCALFHQAFFVPVQK